jgi:hypothetical protein
MKVPKSPRNHETWVGKHITGPIAETVSNIGGDLVGSILALPFKAVDYVVDKSVAGVRDFVKNAVNGIVRFPTKK